MRKFTAIAVCTIALSLSTLQLVAQTDAPDFEKGTVVLDNGSNLDALIKVEKWNLSPTEVTIKRAEDANPETLSIDQVQSFSIPAFVKFVRDTVQSDISGVKKRTMLEGRHPFYEQRVVFLRILVEGEASLYSYRNPIKEQFYYKKSGSELTHLVSKRYLASPNRIATNNQYQQQLYTELRCGDVELDDMTRINYEIDDLTKYFLSYNRCKGSEAVSFHRVDSQGEFDIYFSGGLSVSNLTVSFPNEVESLFGNLEYGSITHLSLNAGLEWVLPFNTKDWSVLGGFEYHTFETNTEFNKGPNRGSNATFDASFINLQAELRKYFSHGNHNNFFVAGAMGVSFNEDSKISVPDDNFEQTSTNVRITQLSAGYLWEDFLLGKVTYTLPYDVFDGFKYIKGKLNMVSFSLGVKL